MQVQRLGHFHIVERVGSGGEGVVYLAHDQELGRDVAIKVLSEGTFSNELARKHFRKEALTLSRLNHPNIETVHEFGTQDGVDFLVMEYVQGRSLNQLLTQGPLPETEILWLGTQLANGLAAAHENAVLHLDLKPGNLRVTPDRRLKILDFGLARKIPQIADEATTESGEPSEKAAGTLPYMAPEQLLHKKLDVRTDIYSAGVVLYEMAVGHRPFAERELPRLVEAILHHPPKEMTSGISSSLEGIILKCLDKNPDRRYQTARELRVDLERLTESDTASKVRSPARLRYRWLRPALTGVIALVLALAGLVLFQKWLPQDQPVTAGKLPARKHLAVLPFTSMGEGPSHGAFCDGLTETLTSELTQLTQFQDSLWVIPTTEIRHEGIRTVRQARSSFGATLVLTGTCIRKQGDRLYLVINLVDSKSLRQLRTVDFETSVEGLALQKANMALEVAEMLELKPKPPEKQRAEVGTSVSDAYDYYLQGLGFLYRYDKAENLDAAIRLFQGALELDPQYALAYAGLAEAYWQKYDLTGDSSWVEPARKNCLRAVELNDQLAPVRVTLGTIQTGTGWFEEALVQFRRALQLDPTNFDAHMGLARAYEAMGQLQKAESGYRAAIDQQSSVWYGYNLLGRFYYRASRYPEAIEMFKEVVRLLPDSARGYSNLSVVLAEFGQYEEAISRSQKSIEIRPTSDGYWSLAYAYFVTRHFPESTVAYQQAVQLRERKHYSILGGLGDAYYWSPGQREKAWPVYEDAIRLAEEELMINPTSADAWIMLAHFNAKLGQKDRGINSLRHALELKPDNPHFLFLAGLAYNEMGQPDLALDMLHRAVHSGYSRAELNRIDFDNLREQIPFQKLAQQP